MKDPEPIILEEIDELKKQVQELDLDLASLLKIIPNFRLDWGISDSKLNEHFNIGATKPIILTTLSNSQTKLHSNQLLVSNDKIANHLFQSLIANKIITISLLKELHTTVIPNGGNLRKHKVEVEYNDQSKHITFTLPEKIEVELNSLTEWYNFHSNENKYHPLLLSIVFHYELIKIHPFEDGNGRITRIITSLMLLSHGIPPPRFEELDRIFYLQCLRIADDGQLLPLLELIGKKIIISFKLILDTNLK